MTSSASSACSAGNPLTSVCMLCHHLIGPDQHRTTPWQPGPALVTHGICIECVPDYCAREGLTKEDSDRIIAASISSLTPINSHP